MISKQAALIDEKMWSCISRVRVLSSKRKLVCQEVISQGRRFFLSESFRCQDAWEKRLKTPLLQNLKLGDLYNELEQKFHQDGKASAVDIDIFANAVQDESYVDELEDLVHKLRLSPNAFLIFPSTSHALIRTMLAFEKHNDLLRILNDRLNYGVFPDDYCSCLLMDTYIKKNMFTEAAKVSVLLMLQEDWSNPLARHLALYSCHMFLTNKCTWEEEILPEDDTGEEIKVRVKYIRNPYFDDHFDLRDPKLLVGKTLAMLGTQFPDAVGHTYQLIGWCLYRKWDKAVSFLEQLLKSQEKPIVYKAGIKMVEDIIEDHLSEKSEDAVPDIKAKILPLLEALKSNGLASDDDLHAAVEAKVKPVVKQEEQKMIEQQAQLYQEWDETRENVLQEELKKLETQNRLARVKEEKEQLVRKEQELFFFDNEDKWDLIIEKKNSFVPTRRWEGKKKKKRVQDENYVPPEL